MKSEHIRCSSGGDRLNRADSRQINTNMAEIKETLLSNQEEDSDSFLSETSARICSRNEHAVPVTGKWVLFCHDLTLKRIWPEICDLYRNDQMEGIERLESSPEECCYRLHGHGWVMVTFICGPCDKFELVLKYGIILLKLLHRCVGSFDVDCLYYTHETLTALTTRDGDDNNPHIKADYEIEIPKKWRSDNHLTLLRLVSFLPTTPNTLKLIFILLLVFIRTS